MRRMSFLTMHASLEEPGLSIWHGTLVFVCCRHVWTLFPLVLQRPVLLPMVSEWLTQIPAGRLAEVEDLQAAVVYLASDASSYMVGHELVIDGGHSMW